MKTCPVCKTMLFDDMEVCYGCMYLFGSKPELEQRTAQESKQESQQQDRTAQTTASASSNGSSRWSIRLEMRNEVDPARSWSMEFAPSRVIGRPVMP